MFTSRNISATGCMPGVTWYSLSLQAAPAGLLFAIVLALFFTGCKPKELTPDEKALGYFKKKWEVKLPAGAYYSSPALSSDERIVYTGTSKKPVPLNDTSQVFVAFNAASGNRIWTKRMAYDVLRAAPVIAPDGSILLVVERYSPVTQLPTGDELLCISDKGAAKWRYNINHGAQPVDVGISTPAVGEDGTIYVAGDSLYAIRSDGTLKWRALGTTHEMMRSSPVIGDGGIIYFVSHNVPLTAFDPADGSVIWSCSLGVDDHCFASPAISENGTIIAATQPGIVYAVSPQGTVIWSFSLSSAGFSGFLRSSPAVDTDGSIYIGINNGDPVSAFLALKADGTLKWIFEPGNLPSDVPSTHFDIYSSPALGTGNLVFFGQEFGRVYALDRSDGSLVGLYETKSGITWPSPALGNNGMLYINDLVGTVYALQTTTAGLDNTAPWPKYRSNNSNNGRK